MYLSSDSDGKDLGAGKKFKFIFIYLRCYHLFFLAVLSSFLFRLIRRFQQLAWAVQVY